MGLEFRIFFELRPSGSFDLVKRADEFLPDADPPSPSEKESRQDLYLLIKPEIGLKLRNLKRLEIKYRLKKEPDGRELWAKLSGHEDLDKEEREKDLLGAIEDRIRKLAAYEGHPQLRDIFNSCLKRLREEPKPRTVLVTKSRYHFHDGGMRIEQVDFSVPCPDDEKKQLHFRSIAFEGNLRMVTVKAIVETARQAHPDLLIGSYPEFLHTRVLKEGGDGAAAGAAAAAAGVGTGSS